MDAIVVGFIRFYSLELSTLCSHSVDAAASCVNDAGRR
jgi:hypothetical protein